MCFPLNFLVLTDFFFGAKTSYDSIQLLSFKFKNVGKQSLSGGCTKTFLLLICWSFVINRTVAYFPWWRLTFKLCERNVRKSSSSLFDEWWGTKDRNGEKDRKRWVECSLAWRQRAFHRRLVAVIDTPTQVAVAVHMYLLVRSAELWALRVNVGITLLAVEPRQESYLLPNITS